LAQQNTCTLWRSTTERKWYYMIDTLKINKRKKLILPRRVSPTKILVW
jgi:hypothetical protein